jgi:hypothetical protein
MFDFIIISHRGACNHHIAAHGGPQFIGTDLAGNVLIEVLCVVCRNTELLTEVVH